MLKQALTLAGLPSFHLCQLDHITIILSWAEDAQNSLRHSAMELMPFQCVLDYQPSLFPWNANPIASSVGDEWFRWSELVWENGHRHFEQVAQRNKEFTD